MCLRTTGYLLLWLAAASCLAGCYPPSQSSYPPIAWEQPLPVHLFYGRVVAISPAEIAYPGATAGVGLRIGLSPYVAGVGAGAAGPAGGFGVAAGFAKIYF